MAIPVRNLWRKIKTTFACENKRPRCKSESMKISQERVLTHIFGVWVGFFVWLVWVFFFFLINKIQKKDKNTSWTLSCEWLTKVTGSFWPDYPRASIYSNRLSSHRKKKMGWVLSSARPMPLLLWFEKPNLKHKKNIVFKIRTLFAISNKWWPRFPQKQRAYFFYETIQSVKAEHRLRFQALIFQLISVLIGFR